MKGARLFQKQNRPMRKNKEGDMSDNDVLVEEQMISATKDKERAVNNIYMVYHKKRPYYILDKITNI